MVEAFDRLRRKTLKVSETFQVSSMRKDGHQAIGMFRFRPGLARHAQQRGDLIAAQPIEQVRLPAQARRGDADGGERVADVVLAVAIRALAVFPRLAPVDRGQADEDRVRRQTGGQRLPHVEGEGRAHLQRMLARRVVRDHRRLGQPRHRPADQIPLGGVQVAAGWVDAQRPPLASVLFPGGKRQAVKEESRDAGEIRRRGRDEAELEAGGVGRLVAGPDVRQLDQRRAAVAPERIGLRRPIETTGTISEPAEMVLGRLMIREDRVLVLNWQCGHLILGV